MNSCPFTAGVQTTTTMGIINVNIFYFTSTASSCANTHQLGMKFYFSFFGSRSLCLVSLGTPITKCDRTSMQHNT